MPTIPIATKITARMHSALNSMPATLPEATAGHGRRRTAIGHGRRRTAIQHLVAGGVPEAVVDGLEAVEVAEEMTCTGFARRRRR
jgi:hypothetical protein